MATSPAADSFDEVACLWSAFVTAIPPSLIVGELYRVTSYPFNHARSAASGAVLLERPPPSQALARGMLESPRNTVIEGLL